MIREGLELMAIGMSGVFVFLLLLVSLMQASGRVWVVLARWLPEPPSEKASPSRPGLATASIPGPAVPAASEAEQVAIAIAAAVAASSSTASSTAASAAHGTGAD